MSEGAIARAASAFAFAVRTGARFPWLYAAGIVGWGAVTALPLASAWVLGKTVEAISSAPFDVSRVLGFAVLFAALELLRVVTIYAALDVDHRHRFLASATLRVNLIRGAMRASASREGIPPGDVVDRARSDVQSAENAMSEVGDLVSQTVFLIGAIFMMSALSWSAAVGGVAVVVVVVLLATVLGPTLESRIERQRSADADYTAMLGAVLEHRSALRRAGSGAAVRSHLAGLASKRSHRNVARQTLALLLSNAAAAAPYLGIGVFLLLGAGSLGRDAESISHVVTAIYLFLFLSDSAVTFANYVDYIRATRIALDRASPVLGAHSGKVWAQPVPGIGSVIGSHPQSSTRSTAGRSSPSSPADLLERLPVPAEEGKVIAIVGATGSGKTTVLRSCLDVWEQETSGGLRQPVGYLPQNPVLMNTTVRENVLIDRSQDDTALWRALDRARLTTDIAQWPQGADKPVGPGGSDVSGGQRQRITLAQAIYTTPAILVLDDPFSALDEATSSALANELLGPERTSNTVLVATSRMALALRADTVLIVERGRVTDFGTPEVVLSRSSWTEHTK